jgi:hypothetical protein
MGSPPGRGRLPCSMDELAISEKIEHLNAHLIPGRPIAMGAALFDACVSRGLIAMDCKPPGANPTYLALAPIIFPTGLLKWEFEVAAPRRNSRAAVAMAPADYDQLIDFVREEVAVATARCAEVGRS